MPAPCPFSPPPTPGRTRPPGRVLPAWRCLKDTAVETLQPVTWGPCKLPAHLCALTCLLPPEHCVLRQASPSAPRAPCLWGCCPQRPCVSLSSFPAFLLAPLVSLKMWLVCPFLQEVFQFPTHSTPRPLPSAAATARSLRPRVTQSLPSGLTTSRALSLKGNGCACPSFSPQHSHTTWEEGKA